MASALNISAENMRCERLATILQDHGIAAHITPNLSVVVKTTRHQTTTVEPGCRIVFTREQTFRDDVQRVWPSIRSSVEHVQCGFIESPRFRGCVFDYLAETRCPG